MKFLTVCQYGHSRSVALVRVLHGRGYYATAAGFQTAGPMLGIMCHHVDRILILDKDYDIHVPPACRHKIVNFHVGPDRWSNPYNAELLSILESMVDEKLDLEPRRTL